jgi:DNA polymerase-1
MTQHTLILVDGSSYLYRAFHALPPLKTATGSPTGAVYGITNMLKNLLKEYQPTHIAVVFDAKGKTFRHDLYPEYKATRAAMPDELVSQITLSHQVIAAMGFPILMINGVEADDVIGSLAKQAEMLKMPTLIFTGDKDLAQLVNEHITLIDTMKQQRLDRAGVQQKFEVSPEQIVDYLSLVGDSSDNVKGVMGVGAKTAVKWLQEYGSLDNIIENIGKIKGKVAENLRQAQATHLPLTRHILTIKCDIPQLPSPQHLTLQTADVAQLRTLFTQLGFKTWLAELTDNTVVATKNYRIIATEAEFQQWLPQLQQSPRFAFALHTTADHYLRTELLGIALSPQSGETVYLPFASTELIDNKILNRDNILKSLKNCLEDPQQPKIGHQLKFATQVFKNYEIDLKGIYIDTAVAAYLLNSTVAHDLATLVLRYLKRTLPDLATTPAKTKKSASSHVTTEHLAQHLAESAALILQLYPILLSELQQLPNLATLLFEVEMPLIPILAQMERYGVAIDVQKLQLHSVELTKQLQQIEQQVYLLADETFNLNSPKQLQQILFNKLHFPILKKTPKGEPSTDIEVLDELAIDYPLAQLLVEYRSSIKLKSTYIDALPQQINRKTQRIHTTYHQTVTATGRLSSSDPNLQNIPIRSDAGRRIRQAFVAQAGYHWLSFDYAQIELRIMAHLSEDEKLLNAFANDEDIHQVTAAEVFGVALENVSSEQRRRAKAVNFGLIYGMQAFGLSKQLGIKRGEAQIYIDTYFARYPKVAQFMETTRELAKTQGFVETIFGRRLYIPEIHSRTATKLAYAERSAINAPMQGTAADIIKFAMLKTQPWTQTHQNAVKLLMQVHDELVFEVADNLVDEAKQVLADLMSTAATLRVPLRVAVNVGVNWDKVG